MGRRCVIFVNLTDPLPPTTPKQLAALGPHRGSALPTSAPGSLPPSSRRSEVNRRRGLKTTPTLSQRPSLPRLLNIVSLRTLLHRPPNRPSLPHRLPFPLSHSLSPSLSFSRFLSRLGLTPFVLLTSPSLHLSAPTTATKHERRRIFIVTSRAASSDLPPPTPIRPAPSPLPFLCAF